MPHAIVAGVPSGWARQVRVALEKIQPDGWTFSVFPGLHDRMPGIESRQLEGLFAEAVKHNGPHIFGVGDRNRAEIAADIRTFFRLRWMAVQAVKDATSGGPQFAEEIGRAVVEENEWRAAVYPVEKSSPLALPKSGFIADRSVASIWDMCEAFNKEAGYVESVAERVQRFKGEHLKKWDRHNERFFIDREDRVWKDDGPYHGNAPFPRDWKYSSLLPAAFHFDIQHAQGRAFEYCDAIGSKKSVGAGKHCNVDAHGYLR